MIDDHAIQRTARASVPVAAQVSYTLAPRVQRGRPGPASFVKACVFATGLFAGCDGALSDATYTTVDSAGVTIVESVGPAWTAGPELAVDAEPAVRIGAVDGPAGQQLYLVADATRLGDGRIVIVNAGTAELRFYDGVGNHVRTIGRTGTGPGEFQGPLWVAGRADTLVVFDPFQDGGRLTYLDLTGDLLGDQRLVVPGLQFPRPDAVAARWQPSRRGE